MALKTIKRDAFKRGDTACFAYEFTAPYVGFDWSTVLIDCAFTSVESPSDNTGAAASRINQTLIVDSNNVASYEFQLTHEESLNLVPGQIYKDECQLKESAGLYFTTPITGQTEILQDYIV